MLDFAPRDADEVSPTEVFEHDEVDGFVSMTQMHQKLGSLSSQSIPISLIGSPGGCPSSGYIANEASSSLSFITMTRRNPIPEEESGQSQEKGSMSKSQDTVVYWRCSKRSFSRHLDNLTKLRDKAQLKVSQVKHLMHMVLKEFKVKK